ncbi:BCCT family transporter [Kocuria sp. cx-116]|uniref:BCCT family transporter n=1 Tax=Kocuria sp. cx-116 TaxID=2771378 RepID=UPI001CC258E1|nr:BCCT family transporter [Kocuria sp. cx-116]
MSSVFAPLFRNGSMDNTAGFIASAVSGAGQGIRWLSNIDTVLAVGLVGFMGILRRHDRGLPQGPAPQPHYHPQELLPLGQR